MASSSPLNYRLELEFVFAFNEGLLFVERVEKNIPYEIRSQPPFNKILDLSPSRAYNSWGVCHEHGASYRPYENEPLHIARRVLEDEGVPMIPFLKLMVRRTKQLCDSHLGI
jgi:hypothetical protein